jgi:hypothetical protein
MPAPRQIDDLVARYAGWFAVALAAAAAVTTIYFVWLTIAIGYVDVPFWDQWGYLANEEILQLWRHHNEHLILFPRLIFWVDDAVFGGRNQFNIAVILLIQSVHAGLLVLFAKELGYRSPRALLFAGCAIVVLMFAPCQRENFTWGFQVQFMLVFAAFTAGAYGLTRYAATDRSFWLVFTVAAGLVCAGSMSNGLAALPLLGALALALHSRRAAQVLWGAAIVAAIVFMIGYVSPSSGGVSHGFSAASLGYALAYLGNPLAVTLTGTLTRFHLLPSATQTGQAIWLGLGVAVVTGLALLSLVDWASLRRVRAPLASAQASGLWARAAAAWRLRPALTGEAERSGLGLAAVIAFVLATVALTTFGRTSQGAEQALASRYATSVAPLLAAGLLLVGRLWRDRVSPAWARNLGILFFGFCLCVFAWSGREMAAAALEQRNAEEGGMLALAVGSQDTEALSRLTYSPATALTDVERLRDEHKSLFSERWVQAMGKPLGDLATFGVGGRCEGAIEPLSSRLDAMGGAAPSFSPGGEVWAPHDQHPTPTIVLVDARGRVAGLGRIMVRDSDVKDGGIRRNHKLVPWRGELAPGVSGEITAYLLIDGGRGACAIGRAAAEASATGGPGDDSQAQVALTAQDTHVQGSFPVGGSYPNTGSPTRPGPFFGSWAGSDANKGSVILSYGPLPANAVAILTPVLQGPGETVGLSLRARLEPSGKVLAVIEPSGFSQWAWWRVPLPENSQGQQVEVEAVDGGSGWGQWLAVGSSYAQLGPK